MKDYYKILGVEEEASEEEIRARWIELVKSFHPDLMENRENEEKIKEINEAYEVLKDYSKRLDYDLERVLKRSFIKKALGRKERRINIQKIIIPAAILVLFLVIGVVVLRWSHVAKPPKSEVLYKIDRELEKKTASQVPSVKTEPKVQVDKEVPNEIKKEVMPQETTKIVSVPLPPPPSVAEREPKRKVEPAQKILPKSEGPVKIGKEIPKEVPKEMRKEIPQERTKIASAPSSPFLSPAEKEPKRKDEPVPQVVTKPEIPVKMDKEVPKETTKVTLQPGEKLQSKTKEDKEVPKDTGKVPSQESAKSVPQEVVKIDKLKPIITDPRPVQKPETSVKAERVVSVPPPSFAKEEEVKRFFSNYIDRYNRKDIDGFLSFFSSKAVQNQKDGLEGLRIIYTKFFDQSQELLYHLEDMKIMIYENGAEVRARFKVDQILKKRREEKIWKGNIRWVLVREDGALRIIALDYQNEKSP
jgi:hypothetical protein